MTWHAHDLSNRDTDLLQARNSRRQCYELLSKFLSPVSLWHNVIQCLRSAPCLLGSLVWPWRGHKQRICGQLVGLGNLFPGIMDCSSWQQCSGFIEGQYIGCWLSFRHDRWAVLDHQVASTGGWPAKGCDLAASDGGSGGGGGDDRGGNRGSGFFWLLQDISEEFFIKGVGVAQAFIDVIIHFLG